MALALLSQTYIHIESHVLWRDRPLLGLGLSDLADQLWAKIFAATWKNKVPSCWRREEERRSGDMGRGYNIILAFVQKLFSPQRTNGTEEEKAKMVKTSFPS